LKKLKNISFDFAPFIAKKGMFVPNSSFGEVRKALEKLMTLGNYHGPWLTPESKTSFESLMEGVECLYKSGSDSDLAATRTIKLCGRRLRIRCILL
jgi:hypothetical protein